MYKIINPYVCNKMYQIIPESQQNNSKILKEIENNLKRFENLLKTFSKGKLKVADLLLEMIFRYGKIHPSQTFIGNKTDLERETVNRIIKYLCDLDIIKVNPQERKMPGYACTYFIGSWITKDMCKQLCKYLKSFDYFHVKFLCSRTIQWMRSEKVTLVNYIKELYLYNNLSISGPCIRKNGDTEKIISNRKGKMMQKEDNVVTTEKIQEITEILNLTMHGKIKLRAFEDEALEYALNQLMTAYGTIKDEFGFLVSKAADYSSKNRIGPKWARYYNLRDSYKISPDDKTFVAEKKFTKVEKSNYSNKSKAEPRAKSIEEQMYGALSNAKTEAYNSRQVIRRGPKSLSEEIKIMRDWIESETGKKCMKLFGPMCSLDFTQVIEENIDHPSVFEFFKDYPFMIKKFIKQDEVSTDKFDTPVLSIGNVLSKLF